METGVKKRPGAAKRLSLRNRVIVLTGAASGIGAELAKNLAGRGAHLALVDRDEAGLAAVAAGVRERGVRANTYLVDLAETAAIERLPGAVERDFGPDLGPVSVLINNAGMALAGRFEQVPAAQFNRLMAVNFFAAVAMARAFLPQLRASAPAQIVNVSSIFGIIGAAEQVAYSSSKFALRGFSESLRPELAESDIGVTVVHPGGVRTNIVASAMADAGWTPEQVAAGRIAADRSLRMEASEAAEQIAGGLELRRKRMILGSDARVATLLQRLAPVSYGRLLPRAGTSKR